MSKSAADLRREQRKKELEEKKARLKALRAERKGGATPTVCIQQIEVKRLFIFYFRQMRKKKILKNKRKLMN